MKAILAAVLALTLSACGPDIKVNPVETQTVDVPVAQPCPRNVDPDSPPAFPASNEAMKAVPYPAASAALKKNPGDVKAKAEMDANAYYLLQLMAADRLVTRSWIAQLAANLKGCQK